MIDLNKYKGKLIAHRGVHNNKNIPENSIKAFKKALDYNYPIELDIQLTKDKQLVVFHDYNLQRMTGLNSELKNFSLKDLKQIKLLNTNEIIPTLKEVLDLVNGKVLIDIEIKYTKNYKEICDFLINELNNYSNNFIISSFSPRVIKYMKNHSKYTCGLLIKNKTNNKLYDKISKSNLLLLYSNADFVSISKQLLKNKYKTKLITFIWTIKSKEEIKNKDYIYICDNLPYKKT